MSYPDYGTPRLRGVLAEIHAERARQDEKWGEQNHPDGTGSFLVFQGHRIGDLAQQAKTAVDDYANIGRSRWAFIALEELLEALAEDDPAKLRAELVQVAAVAVAWIEAIDRRQS